jgi:hypothetical protein
MGELLYTAKACHPEQPSKTTMSPIDYFAARRWARRALLVDGMMWVEIKPTWTENGCEVIHSSARPSWILDEARLKGETIIAV